jgi:hypothetical protein
MQPEAAEFLRICHSSLFKELWVPFVRERHVGKVLQYVDASAANLLEWLRCSFVIA